jgi:6-phosphogluconolactonase (cycloisomerase 2 family)
MALRTKTIEYAYPLSTASVSGSTARDFTSINISIPETPTFESVILEVSCYDNGNTATSVTDVLIGISLGAIARDDSTVTQTITNSGENQGLIFTRDVTSYFQTNWLGTTMASDCRLTITGMITNNCTAKLIITYQWNDTANTTRIKTVRIPIDGNNSGLINSLIKVGRVSNPQIPNLDSWLPESSKVYRDIFFESYMHTGKAAGTNDRTLSLNFTGSTLLDATYEAALASDFMIKRIDKLLGSISTSSTSDVYAQTSNVDMPFTCLSGILVVTYEYDHSTSTRIMNSIMMPCIDESGWIGGPTTNDESRFTRRIWVEEPGTITLEQSAVMISTIDAGAINLDLTIGNQSPRLYSHPATTRCGSVYQMRRFDPGVVLNPYDISIASFTSIALSVTAQEATPTCMMYNNNGTILYVLGSTGDDINEYALSTPYDISTGTFTQIALSVAGQETTPLWMMYNNNGTVLYVMGSTGDDINEYALSTPYDISTGTFTRIALSVAAQETTPTCMMYNNNGTILYVLGATGDDINEYALSTPYDISTGTFTQIALSVAAQDTDPVAMIYNNDGTVLYVMGLIGQDINEYALSTPYDISTGTFTRIALSVAAQEATPRCMMYNNNGNILYVIGQSGDDVNEYSLTATSSGVSLQRGANDIIIDYSTTGTAFGEFGSNSNGVMFLNYTSDKSSEGDGAHNHTTFWVNRPWTAGLNARTQYSPSTTPNIPESDYFITSIGYEMKFLTSGVLSNTASIAFQGKVQPSEADGEGWYSFYDSLYANDPETACSVIWARARDEYKTYPTNPDNSLLGVETSRDYRIDINPNNGFIQAAEMITYHTITFSISGTVTGGDGINPIIVRAYRTDNGNLIQEVTASTTDGNLTGAFNITWYDNTIDVIVVANQSENFNGSSEEQVAGNTFDISLSSGGGEYGYAFL